MALMKPPILAPTGGQPPGTLPANTMKPLARPGGRTVHVPRNTAIPASAKGEGILAAHVGLPAALPPATASAVLKHRALPQPGGHMALLKRLFGG